MIALSGWALRGEGVRGVREILPLAPPMPEGVRGSGRFRRSPFWGGVGSTPFQACCLVSWARLSGFTFQEIPCSEFLIFQEIHCSENTLSQSEKHRWICIEGYINHEFPKIWIANNSSIEGLLIRMLGIEINLVDVCKNPQSIVAWAWMRMWIRSEKVNTTKLKIIYLEG